MKHLIPVTVGALLFVSVPCRAADEARNLYVEQLKKPSAHVNSGISYSLELDRHGKKSQCSNRTKFHSGDRVRFHVKPNFNGYAYILMMQASQGDHYVLFPTKKFPNNRFVAGRDIAIPVGNGAAAWLKFDNTPGDEVLRVICSRKPINPKNQFHKDDGAVVIASSDSGDHVPDGTSISEEDERNLSVETDKTKSKTKPTLHGKVTVVSHSPAKPLTVDIVLSHND